MISDFSFIDSVEAPSHPSHYTHWHTFEIILERLHDNGIYINSEQLAEFMILHGLPVNLLYVPEHLQAKAILVNQNYQGDMAQVTSESLQPFCNL